MTERRFEYEVTADDSGFRAAMSRVGREAQTAGRDVERSFARAEREFQSITSVASGLRNAFAGALSIGGVAAFGRAVQREMIDAEREVALLNTTLRSTGFSAGLSARQVSDLADELSRATTVDAGDILQGTTALLRFRDISSQTFRDAARLAVDLSVATGRDLPSAFTAVGKALQNPVAGIRGLRDVGVELSEDQLQLAQRLRDSGRAVDAQRLVIEELSKAVGGAGSAGAGGLTGATNRAANAWKDLLGNIGQLPAVAGSSEGALQSLTRFVERFSESIKFFSTPDGGTISGLNSRISALRNEIARQRGFGAETSGLELSLATAERRRSEALRRIGELAVQSSGPQNFDARDYRILGGGPGSSGDASPTDPAAARRRAAERLALLEREYQEALRWGRAFSDAEIREFERQADEKSRIEQDFQRDLQQERERILQEGPVFAERQNRAAAERLNALLGDTKSGRRGSVVADLKIANEAFDAGRITAEQLDDVYGSLRKRIEEIDRGGQKLSETFGQDNVAAIQRLQFAVEGWGRQFTETLASAIETGKLRFSDLVQSVARDLLRLTIQQNVTAPLFGALSGAVGGAFSTRGAPGGGGYIPIAPTTRDSGGPGVAGRPYLIGTGAQPELFVPGTSGQFFPAGSYGGKSLVVNAYIDSRSDVTSVRQAVYQAAQLAQAEMARANRKG